MSSTAGNYDVPKLFFGQAVAGIALFLGLGAAYPTISISLRTTAPLIGISLLYGTMMFASSYVEEEQHFWYWATTAWLTLLWIKWSVAFSSYESKLTLLSNRKQTLNARLLALISISILVATRIARRWNQTGQKFAGEPDIAKTFFFEHKLFLWILIGITYLWNLQSLASRGFPRFPQVAAGAIATALATAAVTFKLAFTNEDSPELMASFAKSVADNESGVSLVLRARILFIALGLILVYTIISGFGHKRPNRSFPLLPYTNPTH
jgi:ethanolaminephosphotransferase